MRRNLLIALMCALLIVVLIFSIGASSEEKEKKPEKSEEIVSDPGDPNGPLELDKSQMLSIEEITEPVSLSSISVYINEPCDEEWRTYYPSDWMYYANYAVELADDKLYSWFGIDFISVAQNVWYSDGNINSLVDRLAEARSEIGHTNGSDIMIAYTKQSADAYGAGVIGQGWSIVRWQGSGTDWKVTRHETGHNYGLQHIGCSNCLINSSYTPDVICEYHYNQWDQNKYLY